MLIIILSVAFKIEQSCLFTIMQSYLVCCTTGTNTSFDKLDLFKNMFCHMTVGMEAI